MNFQNANVSRKAANFRGKKYMVIHGTADGELLSNTGVNI